MITIPIRIKLKTTRFSLHININCGQCYVVFDYTQTSIIVGSEYIPINHLPNTHTITVQYFISEGRGTFL